ncbi:MAG: RsmB/NOP family class I SAM-dependent RNA methyltransferase [Pseudomonadota bacterium]
MTPAARTQAAIELLDTIIAAARDAGAAADTLIARYFATRRYAGSKDRRAVRELVYAAIRACGERPESGRAAVLALAGPELLATFDGSPHGPTPVAEGEPVSRASVAPGWLIKRMRASDLDLAQQQALIGRAPLDLRINRLRADAVSIEGAESIPGLLDGLRLPSGTNVEALPEWQSGAIEVQDAGSQLVTGVVGTAPGERVVDLCAGAGGKTLALAAAMGDEGAILACDTDRGRLSRLPPRAARAGVSIVATRLLDPGTETDALAEFAGQADHVLIDAPCSGTGTWRRNPEARWRLTHDRLAALVALQARLLDIGAALVKPGGALTYVVCSLLDEEGADQVAAFLARSGWSPVAPAIGAPRGPGARLTPLSDATDGFFVAKLRAP